MKLNNLRHSPGAVKSRKRIGRGNASGTGCTAGKGHKGAKSRSGYKSRPWFEGGQMPLQRRLPKRGFTNFNRKEYEVVNVRKLENLENIEEITPEVLLEKRIVRKRNSLVKILGDGDLTRKLTVKAHAFSKTAIVKIEQAGGKAEVVS